MAAVIVADLFPLSGLVAASPGTLRPDGCDTLNRPNTSGHPRRTVLLVSLLTNYFPVDAFHLAGTTDRHIASSSSRHPLSS